MRYSLNNNNNNEFPTQAFQMGAKIKIEEKYF